MIGLVTGAAGFIGSHMVDHLLQEGFEVRGLDNFATGRAENLNHVQGNPRFTFRELDLRQLSRDDALFQGVDYVFHFAGVGDIIPSIERPTDYLSANVMGTVQCLEACRHAGVKKLVYAASSSCYGVADQLPTTESAPIRPEYPYALSKYMAEEAVLHWGQVYHLPVLSIRMFNVYGTRSRTNGTYGSVMGVFLRQKLAEKPFTLVGDGTQTRDWVYVTDVARAFLLAARSERRQTVYNLGSDNPRSVNRLIELLGADQGLVTLPKRPGEPDCTWASIAKISSELGWTPTISLEEGVARILDQIEYWREAPLWDEQSIARATATWHEMMAAR